MSFYKNQYVGLLLLTIEELQVQTLIGEVKQNHRVKEIRKQIGKGKLMGPTCDV